MSILEVEGLVKRYARARAAPVVAVDGVSFTVGRGEVVGLLGSNGAGKSTTLKMACGLVRPDAGHARVAGFDTTRQPRRALRHLAAVLEGNRNLYWRLTARENLEYFAGNRGRTRRSVRADVTRLLARFGLEEKADTVVNGFSRGMQQRLALAVALLADTEVLVLDEPTLGLDVASGLEVRRLLGEIAAEGRTVVLSSHDMATVQAVCERVVVIDGGRVVTDARVAELLRLFRTRGYTVRARAPLGAEVLAGLRAAFPVVLGEAGAHEVHVDLEHGEDVYRLVEVLRRFDVPLESLDHTGVHFEEVFQSVVGTAAGVAA